MKFMCDEMQKGLKNHKTYVREKGKPTWVSISCSMTSEFGAITPERHDQLLANVLTMHDYLADDWQEEPVYDLDLFEMMKMLSMGKTVRQKNNKLSLRWNGSMYEVIDPDEVASINVPTLTDALDFFKTHADEAKVKQWMVVE